MERGARGFKGRSQRRVLGLNSPESNRGGAAVTGMKFGWRLKMLSWPDRWGQHVSEGERGGLGTGLGKASWAVGLLRC
jgi:hypothetical protein